MASTEQEKQESASLYEALGKAKRKYLIMIEEGQREMFGFKKLSDRTMRRLQMKVSHTTKTESKLLIG